LEARARSILALPDLRYENAMSWRTRLKGLFGAKEDSLPSAQELFTAEVEAALAGIPAVVAVTRADDFALTITTDDERTHTAYLQNVFAETRDMSAAERTGRIERFISVVTEPAPEGLTWDDVRERLVPVVRGATFWQGVAELKPIRRRFVPFLVNAVGIDSENSFQYVADSHARDWGVDIDAIFTAARENGEQYFDVSDAEPYGDGAVPMWHVAKDDDYETSRILVPGWLASFEGKVAGRPVAILPSRSRLIIGGDGDERSLAQLIESARREYDASPRSISPALYTVGAQDAVVPLVLPSGHALAMEVAVGHAVLAMSEYNAQQQHLQALLGDDIYVGEVTAIKGDGIVFTYTTWAKDVPSLLPAADYIVFAGLGADGDATIRVPWKVALELAGDSLCFEPGHDLPRWRTERWPDAATFEKLRARGD
jgi:hypothetical protein